MTQEPHRQAVHDLGGSRFEAIQYLEHPIFWDPAIRPIRYSSQLNISPQVPPTTPVVLYTAINNIVCCENSL